MSGYWEERYNDSLEDCRNAYTEMDLLKTKLQSLKQQLKEAKAVISLCEKLSHSHLQEVCKTYLSKHPETKEEI